MALKMSITEITDINDSSLDVFSRISEAQLYRYYEPETGVFLAESMNVIIRALDAGYEPVSFLIEQSRLQSEAVPVMEKVESLYGRERCESLQIYTADTEIVKQLTGYEMVRGMWGLFRRKEDSSLEEFCKDKRHIAVLYDVVNPTNVGAIIRSAAALGMDGAIITFASADPLARRASRVSMGTVFQLPWTKAAKEERGAVLTDKLKSLGFKTVAMALTEDSVSVDNEELHSNEKIAVILGSEGPGLPDEVMMECDYRVKIPMYHNVDSLNVAAASAVVFWELSKRK